MVASPRYRSRIPKDTDISAAHLGASMMGVTLLPQGEVVAGVLQAVTRTGAPLYPQVGILIPRRSTKTTSIWATLIGRCATIEGYRVVTTAQDGTRAGNVMRERMRDLEANGFEQSGGVLRWSNGRERIEFANGSVIWVVAPNAAAFRSEAADAMLFDEAGEYDVAKSDDLLAGALPLMDTRPNGQVIIAGTPAVAREGLLWETLAEGRDPKRKAAGIVEYSLPDDVPSVLLDPDDPDAEPRLNEKALRKVHPGIGTLTTIQKMRERFEKMPLAIFEREYFCRFPTSVVTSAIDPEKWAAAQVPPVDRPERVGIAFDVHVQGLSASICYAWRDDDGNAYIEVAKHEPGTSWLTTAIPLASTKHGKGAVAYDVIGANIDPASAVQRLRKAPRLEQLHMKDVQGASQRLVSELNEGRLRQFGQVDLDAAVANTTWRQMTGGRAFGTKVQGAAPINPLVAASLALWSYDRTKPRARARLVID